MQVSIIIVNWNGRQHLPDCLGSLEKQTFSGFEVVLVDNGSSDGSVEYVRECYPWVKLVILPNNSGFAAGNNIGLSHSSAEYIVTLNNDTMAEPDWLAELVAVADEHPEAGMLASRICNFHDRDQVDSIGFRVCRDGMSRGAYRLQNYSALALERVEETLFPSACVALYRRAMIDETGFFDEDFFAYCEDTDLGLRGRLAGWGALLARDAVIYHKYSQTAGTFSPLKLYLVERNHYWAALKTFPLSLLLLLPYFTVARFLVQAATVLSGKGSGGEFLASGSRSACIGAILRGIRDAVRGIPRILRQRRQVMRTRRLSAPDFTLLLKRYRLSFRELLDDGSDAVRR
ncbi:MAG: glycosyltransferase family 2 protein [Desulfuromonadales bacterium]|nr:glycosyltransferase family 2 protein [Desulfuromonadales bacterium]